MKAIILAAILLAGCATTTHKVEHRVIAGKTIEIHTDAPESLWPAEAICQRPWDGCSDVKASRVFLTTPVKEEDAEHELDHHAGMVHGLWVDYGRLGTCAYVYISGKKYQANTMICKTRKGERIYGGSEFFKIAGGV